MTKPLVLLDYNGTVHAYREGWKKGMPAYDDPTPGFGDWVRSLNDEFRIAIYPARLNSPIELRYIKGWLHQHHLDRLGLELVDHIPIGVKVKIDDRALHYGGDWSEFPAERLRSFKTWSGR